MHKPLLTEEELADMLHFSRSMIFGLRQLGLPFLRIRRSIRYDEQLVREWLKKNTHNDLTASPTAAQKESDNE